MMKFGRFNNQNHESGVFVAVSDYMKSLSSGISRWLPGPLEVLGTDGYGLSETKSELRAHFEINADYIAQASLAALLRQKMIKLNVRLLINLIL